LKNPAEKTLSQDNKNPTPLYEKWDFDIQPMLPSAKGLRIAERNHLNYATSPAEMQHWILVRKMRG